MQGSQLRVFDPNGVLAESLPFLFRRMLPRVPDPVVCRPCPFFEKRPWIDWQTSGGFPGTRMHATDDPRGVVIQQFENSRIVVLMGMCQDNRVDSSPILSDQPLYRRPPIM